MTQAAPGPRTGPCPPSARLDAALDSAWRRGRPLLGGSLPAGVTPANRAAWRALASSADLLEVGWPTRDAYENRGRADAAQAAARPRHSGPGTERARRSPRALNRSP